MGVEYIVAQIGRCQLGATGMMLSNMKNDNFSPILAKILLKVLTWVTHSNLKCRLCFIEICKCQYNVT